MSSGTGNSKADERRARNLASANASRQRRREQISSLTEEKARLTEANALLRNRLKITPNSIGSGQGPSYKGGSSSSRPDMVELGPGMQSLMRKKEMEGKAVVDLLDRAVSGGKGKGSPLDPDAAKKWAAASKKAPKDVKRPLQSSHADQKYGGSSSKHDGKSSKSGSKSKASSSGKKR